MKSKTKIVGIIAISLAIVGTGSVALANTNTGKTFIKKLVSKKSIYDNGSGSKFDNIREQPTFEEELASVENFVTKEEKEKLLSLGEDLKKYEADKAYDKVGDTWTEIYRITTKYNTSSVPSFFESIGSLADHLDKDQLNKLEELYNEVKDSNGSEKAWSTFHKAVDEHLKIISPQDVYNYPTFENFIESYKDSLSKEDLESVEKLYSEMESQVKALEHEKISETWNKINKILGVNE